MPAMRPELNGQNFKSFINGQLDRFGYTKITPVDMPSAQGGSTAVFAQRYHVGNSIYGRSVKADFLIYHPAKHSNSLIIQARWQQSSGSVDEKLPYLYENLENFSYPSILILDGRGYRPSAKQWIQTKIRSSKNLKHVFTIEQFLAWGNNGKL